MNIERDIFLVALIKKNDILNESLDGVLYKEWIWFVLDLW